MSELQQALAFAFRHRAHATEMEREAILAAMAEHFHGPEGETASRSLYHLREQKKQQFLLAGLLGSVDAHEAYVAKRIAGLEQMQEAISALHATALSDNGRKAGGNGSGGAQP